MTPSRDGHDQAASSEARSAKAAIDVREWTPRMRWLVLAIGLAAFGNGALIGSTLKTGDLRDSLRQAIDTGERCVSGWKETVEKLKQAEAELTQLKAAPKP